MSLYLKYRPRTIEELDLASVRQALTDMVKANQVSHAYLLTGPRGSGKTSTARVIARMVNCEKNANKLGEPCNECSACQEILSGASMDFVEIDAASNRGIDDIRSLKEKIRLAPSSLKYKIYIIDEVHMLTTEAFNALLKTLEEPPSHAIFVLCTTETHKVPETIVSRCVQIKFAKASSEEMQRSLRRVVEGEGKKVSGEALEYLAKSVDGSFRDGVKILETALATNKEVGLAEIEMVVTGSKGFSAQPLAEALAAKDGSLALQLLGEGVEQGVELVYLTVETMKALKEKVMAGGDTELTRLIFAFDEAARRLGTSPVPELLLEMTIVEWCEGADNQNTQKTGEPEKSVNQKNPRRKSDKSESVKKREVTTSNSDHKEVWQKLMTGLNGDSITLTALLAKAVPAQIQGDELTIQVQYGFHRDQIQSDKVMSKLEKMVSEMVGRPMKVRCEVVQSATIAQAEAETDPVFAEAEKIFIS